MNLVLVIVPSALLDLDPVLVVVIIIIIAFYRASQ